MIIYTCPKCGANCTEETLLTYPPQIVVKCTNCDWADSRLEDIIKVPFNEE